MNLIQLDTPLRSLGEGLGCPHCGNFNLHQYRVSTFFRYGEDSTTGLAVTALGFDRAIDAAQNPPSLEVTSSMAKNPSPRRDGLQIWFSCEHGCDDPVLEIIQHKGTTFVQWAEGVE